MCTLTTIITDYIHVRLMPGFSVTTYVYVRSLYTLTEFDNIRICFSTLLLWVLPCTAYKQYTTFYEGLFAIVVTRVQILEHLSVHYAYILCTATTNTGNTLYSAV